MRKSLPETSLSAREKSDSAKIYFRAWRRAGMESAGRSRKRASPHFWKNYSFTL